MKDILIADYFVVSCHALGGVLQRGAGARGVTGGGAEEGRAQSQACLLCPVSSQVCTVSRDTRGSLSASSLGCLHDYNTIRSLTPICQDEEILFVLVLVGWIKPAFLVLMNLFPSYIIITLDNTPSFLVSTPFLVSFLCFDQNNSPADKITSGIETVNPGKTLVHFTLSPEHGCLLSLHLSALIISSVPSLARVSRL